MSSRTFSPAALEMMATRQVDGLLKLRGQQARLKKMRRRAENWRKNPYLVWELLARSIPAARGDATAGDQLVELAHQAVVLRGEVDGVSLEHIYDLMALVTAYRGNVRRLERSFMAAEECFQDAWAFLERGMREPRVVARVESLWASVLLDTLRFPAAVEVLRRAESRLAREQDRRAERGRILLQLQIAHASMGHSDAALECLQQACEQLHGSQDRELTATSYNNLASELCIAHRFHEAKQVMDQAREVFDQVEGSKLHLYRTWAEGRIYQGLGQRYEALRRFSGARAGFLAHNNAWDALLVSLDLAGLHLHYGSEESVAQLAEDIRHLLEHEQVRSGLSEEGRTVLGRFLLAAAQRNATETLHLAAVAALGRERWRKAHREVSAP